MIPYDDENIDTECPVCHESSSPLTRYRGHTMCEECKSYGEDMEYDRFKDEQMWKDLEELEKE